MIKDNPNLYEGMYIVSSTLSDDARQKALERIEQEIKERGGEINKVFDFERRRLAYDIAGHREGHYYVIYFTVKPSAISEIWHEYHLNEDLIRFMTFRVDEVPEEIKFKQLEEAQA